MIRIRRTAATLDSRSSADDGGAALVEFAVVLPILLTLIFGMIEFGIAFNRAQAIEAAAREGARLGSISTSSASDIRDRALLALDGLPIGSPSVSVNGTVVAEGDTSRPCQGNEGQTITVDVTAIHQVTVPMVIEDDIDLQAQAVFRCEA